MMTDRAALRIVPLAATLAAVLLYACAEQTGPGSLLGRFAIAPIFTSEAAGIVPVTAGRFVLRRTADGVAVKDTVVVLDGDSVDLTLTVPLQSAGETFELTIALVGPAGDTVFRAGPLTVTPSTGGDVSPIAVALDYTGPGANAAGVVILSPDTSLFFGEAATLVAEARDSAGQPLPGTPIEWRSLDSARVRVPAPDSGRVVGNVQRGNARIVARLLTNQADTVQVAAQPVPNSIVTAGGDGQVGLPGAMLPQPLAARVLAADAQGVQGVWVRFAVVAGGGTISPDSVLTAADGRAEASLTLGGAGPQVVEATTARLPGVGATFGATAATVGGTQVSWINAAGGNWSAGANWSTGTAPGLADTVLITAGGLYTVTLDVSTSVAALTLGGASGTPTLAAVGQGITVNGPTDIAPTGALSLTTSTLSGPLGTITNDGLLSVTSSVINDAIVNNGTLELRGTSALNGPVTNTAGATMAVEGTGVAGNADVTITGGATNLGTLALTHPGAGGGGQSVTLIVTGGLVNEAGAILESTPGVGGGARTLTAALDNRGAIVVTQPLTIDAASATHLNSGTITVEGGNLTIAESGIGASLTSTGTITVLAGRSLTISGGGFQTEGSALNGAGGLTLTDVIWDIGTGYVVDSLTLTHTGGAIVGGGLFDNQGAATVLANVTVNAPLANGGTMGLRGTTALNGTFQNAAGATVAIEATGVAGNAMVTVTNGFTNLGVLTLTHPGAGGGGQSATLTVGGTLVNGADGTISSTPGVGGGARTLTAALDNQGSLIVAQALTLDAASAQHSNSGTILLQGANLTLTQSGTVPAWSNTGTLRVESGRLLVVNGGSFTAGGSTLTGPGAVTLNGVIWDIGAGYVVDSLTLTHSGGTLIGTGPLTNRGAATVLAGVTVGVPLVNEGTLGLRGTTAVNGALSNALGATLAIEATGVAGDAVVTVANGFTNLGFLSLTHPGVGGGGQSATLVVSTGTLVNDTMGQILSLPGVGGGLRGLTATLDNRGIVSVDQPLTWTNGAIPSTSSALMLVNTDLTLVQAAGQGFTNLGGLVLGTGAKFTVTGGTFGQTPPGYFSGTGTLDVAAATVTGVDGSVLPGTSPGVLTVTGNLPLARSSFLLLELAGPAVGTGFDRLSVSGTATLDGQVSAVLSYPAAVGDSFPAITFGSRAGTLASLAAVATQNGVFLDTVPTANSLSFVARSQVLFAGFDGALGGMFRANADGSGFQSITTEGPPNSNVSYPRWAPDRTRLTYSANNAPPPFLLHVTSWNGTEISHPVNDTNTTRPRFSLNGAGQLHLAFVCGDQFFSSSVDVCVVGDVSGPIPALEGKGDGGGKVFVTDAVSTTLGGTGAFAWNPQNPDQLAVVRDSLFAGQFVTRPASQIWLVNFDGSGRAPLTSKVLIVPDGQTGAPDTLQIEFMDWSPNGSFIVFSAIDQQFNAALYRMEVATGVVTQLTIPTTLEDDEQPVVSPDNSTILFIRNDFALESSNWNLWRVPATGGTPTQITGESPNVFFGTSGITYDWSPDGTDVVMVGSDGVNTGIYVIDPFTTNANNYLSVRRLVGRTPANDVQPSWRP